MPASALPTPPNPTRFKWLAFTASLFTFLLITIGGFVRTTGAGMGCGAQWPWCNGQIFPPLDFSTLIEISHRFVTIATTPLVVLTAIIAWRSYRHVRWIMWPAAVAVGLLVMQILLGAVTVTSALPPAVVALHLANAMAVLGALLIVTVVAFQIARDPRVGDSLLHFDLVSRLTGTAVVSVFVLIVSGALVTAMNASWACAGWPLCDGSLTPDSFLGLIHMGHRYVAAVVGVVVIAACLRAWQLRRQDAPVAVAAAVTAALFVAQVAVGALNVLNGFPAFINGLHVATATAVWASMVVLGVLSMQYVRLSPLKFAIPHAGPLQLRTVLADYVILTKPIIMVLLLTTTIAAMIVAGHGWPPMDLLFWTVVGGGLASGGASALNQVIDRDLDKRMARTSRRPLAEGRIDPASAWAFGLILSIASFYVLALFVNPLSAVLALFGNVYYVLGYTVLLKKSTVQNIVIGGGAGAVPPLVGWAAATGSINLPALFLFAIVFFWTPPHFWALALLKKNDYARADVPMLPVVWGEAETRWHILLYTLLVVALSLMLTPARVAGLFYLASAAVLGGVFIVYAFWLFRVGGNKVAWQLYKYSSLYLALIFAALVIDRFVGPLTF